MFYFKDELLDFFRKSGINAYECESTPKSDIITLCSSDLQSLIDYAKENNVKNFFYSYKYANKDFYIIDYSKIHESRDFLNLVNQDIEFHIKHINSIDFEQPALLDVFCLHNGIAINMREQASWLDDLTSSEECIANLKEKYLTALEEIKDKRNKEKEPILEELKAVLLNDSEFALCSNQNLRRDFMRRFLAKKENEHFKNAFYDSKGYLSQYDYLNFADLVYSIYKKQAKGK